MDCIDPILLSDKKRSIDSDKPVIEYVPLHRPTSKSEDVPIKIVTQFEMSIIDHLGLLKVDFLGLATLTIMQQACILIEERHGVKYHLGNIPIDDPETYAFLGKGFTAGVFQLEGTAMTRFLVQMQPSKLDHIIAMVALYRPGPMKSIPEYIDRMKGRAEITYKHPMLEPIMSETYGIAIYQEQLMQACIQLGGYTAGEADILRKVISKKKAVELEKHKNKFVAGAVEKGIDEKIAYEIFTDWEGFAHYGFNKSHAADYGVIAIQTAFLKTHYPLEYMTALLSQSKNDSDKVAFYVSDCRAMEITINPPDINYSGWDFGIEDHDERTSSIRFGLGAIKNVGRNPIEIVINARNGGPFADINDFARRVDLRKVGRRPLECMIRVGAFDSMGSRCSIFEKLGQIIAVSESHFRAKECGQLTFFGTVEGMQEEIQLSETSNVNKKAQLEWEKELLGLYLTDHPLSDYMPFIRERITHYSKELSDAEVNCVAIVAGYIEDVRIITTSKGAEMAFVKLVDIQGDVELVIFPRTWKQFIGLIRKDEVLFVKGKVDKKRAEPKILVDHVQKIDLEKLTALQAEFGKGNNKNDQGISSHSMNNSSPDQDLDILQSSGLEESSGEHNKNGDQHGNQAKEFPPQGIEDAGEEYQPQIQQQKLNNHKVIEIILHSTGSQNRDTRRMRQLFGLLTSTLGKDRFAFICRENGKKYRVDFPNYFTDINDSLINEISGMVGEANIRISP